jgi:hypothetical protein
MGARGGEAGYGAVTIARAVVFALLIVAGVELETKTLLHVAFFVEAAGAVACAIFARRLGGALGVRNPVGIAGYALVATASFVAALPIDWAIGSNLIVYPMVLTAGTCGIIAAGATAWVVDGRSKVRTIAVPLVPGLLALGDFFLYGIARVLGGMGGGHYSPSARLSLDRFFFYSASALWLAHAVLHARIVRAAQARRMSE